MTAFNRVAQAIAYIRQNLYAHPSLETVANEVAISPYHFQRQFSELTGLSPRKFQEYLSTGLAKDLLHTNRYKLEEVAELSNLSGTGRLHDYFIKLEAMTPGTYKNGGEGLTLHYSLQPSPYGNLFVATTNIGVCGVEFVNSVSEAESILQKKWPSSKLVNHTEPLHIMVADTIASAGNGTTALHFHLKGTPFQLKVWEALLTIPTGFVAAYQDIADSIGAPTSSRAVGTAIGANPIAVLIPCHRVLRKEGAIGEYHWGSQRKLGIICHEQLGLIG